MLLTIDIGNTNTCFGFFREKELITSFRIATDHAKTSDECGLILSQFTALRKLQPIDGVIIATVVPRLESVYRHLANDYCRLEPVMVTARLKLNIRFDYPNPSEIGADRICNSAAAFDRFGGPTIVVDFGTATSFDIISQEGAYIGGVIAPGIETAQSALAHKAAQLFKISLEPPRSPIGKSTEEAMKSGFYYGAIGHTDYIIEQITAALRSNPKVIATGGLAAAIAPASRFITEILPDITLEGLRLIYELNRG